MLPENNGSLIQKQFTIFAPNTNPMTQPALKQSMSFVEFTDSVFSELYHWETEYSYFDMKELADWKNTIIPLGINLYELAQTDDAVYWWLLQLMSQVDVCKDWKEDFRKSDVFSVFSKLKRGHQKIILEKCVPNCAEELQKTLENDEQDAFKRILPVIDENGAFYSIVRMLKRVEEVRDIYEKTMSHTEGDSLGRLFVLFRRYYEYFANSYDNNHRSCDGMAKNVFLALYQTQYREDNNEFCKVTHEIGTLWVRGLVWTYHNYNTQMPPAASDMVLGILQKQYKEFCDALNDCITEKKKISLMEEYGGWFELEEYSFIYNVFQVSKKVRSETTPPFSCLCTDKKKKRKRICGNSEQHDIREKIHNKDNYVPYIESNNAISLEELFSISLTKNPGVTLPANTNYDTQGVIVEVEPKYPGSKWGFIPDNYYELRPDINNIDEYFDTEFFEEKWREKGIEHFADLINYIARVGYIPDDDEYKAMLAYRLTGLNRPDELKKIPWSGKSSKDSPLELYYLVKKWVKQNHKKNPQCKDFFVGPHWIKNPSSRVKDCNRQFQRKLNFLFNIPPEYKEV